MRFHGCSLPACTTFSPAVIARLGFSADGEILCRAVKATPASNK